MQQGVVLGLPIEKQTAQRITPYKMGRGISYDLEHH